MDWGQVYDEDQVDVVVVVAAIFPVTTTYKYQWRESRFDTLEKFGSRPATIVMGCTIGLTLD